MTGYLTTRSYVLGAVSVLYLSVLSPGFAGKAKIVPGTNIDFNSYKTYQWLPVKILTKTGIVEDDPEVAPIIRTAVNRELTARGLTEVKEGGDLQVVAAALNTFVPQLEAVIFPGGLPLDYATPIATMGRYNKEGTLAVNLIDSKTKKSAWVGLITESIDNKPGSGLGKIPKAAQKIFDKYPVKKR